MVLRDDLSNWISLTALPADRNNSDHLTRSGTEKNLTTGPRLGVAQTWGLLVSVGMA